MKMPPETLSTPMNVFDLITGIYKRVSAPSGFMRKTVSSICKNKLEKRYNPLPISPSGCQLRHPIAWNGHEPLAIGDVLIASQKYGNDEPHHHNLR
jgi:hypothetical protein